MGNINIQAAIWLFLIPLVAILLPVWLGQRYGHFIKKKSEVKESPVSTTVGATLGLFGFMLAFAFQIVGGRYEKRKELLLSEISEIRTTYLYCGLVPEPVRSDARRLVLSYVDYRVELAKNPEKLEEVKLRSQAILDSLWKSSETLASQDRNSEAYSLFFSTTGNLIQLFNERITLTFQIHLPKIVLYVLGLVGFLSMLMLGYQFGISGQIKFGVNFFLAITFASVMWLVLALDRPEAGIITLGPESLLMLQKQLHQY